MSALPTLDDERCRVAHYWNAIFLTQVLSSNGDPAALSESSKPYCGMILLSIDGADGVSDTQEKMISRCGATREA